MKCRVYRDRENGKVKLSQENFTWEMLTRYSLLNISPAPSPTEAGVELPAPEEITDEEVKEVEHLPFRER